jgi:IPTL-CTERM motif
MKVLSFLLLLTVLFVSGYALAQPCPCDNQELTNGLSGNDIVDALCPDGTIAEGNIWTLNPSVVAISGDVGNGLGAAYDVFNSPQECEITDFVHPAVFVALTDQEVEFCRERLIKGCSLLSINNKNIPTLSEWGMIAMAGALGMIGLYVAARRRKAAA